MKRNDVVAKGMRSMERVAARVRHSPRLEGLSGVWDSVRPAYNRVLRTAGRGTVHRVINGDTPMDLLVEYRDITEQWEPDVWHSLMSRLRPGDVFVDVGAHIGLYAIGAARRVGAKGRVYAFEPEPTAAAALRRHVAINGCDGIVHVTEAAVGDRSGSVAISSGTGVETSVVNAPVDGAGSVCLTTLNATLPIEKVRGMKVDVEGYEGHVLRGARNVMGSADRAPDFIYLELHPYAWAGFGTSIEEIRGLVEASGYRLRHLDGRDVDDVSNWCEVVAERRSDGEGPTKC